MTTLQTCLRAQYATLAFTIGRFRSELCGDELIGSESFSVYLCIDQPIYGQMHQLCMHTCVIETRSKLS